MIEQAFKIKRHGIERYFKKLGNKESRKGNICNVDDPQIKIDCMQWRFYGVARGGHGPPEIFLAPSLAPTFIRGCFEYFLLPIEERLLSTPLDN